MMKASYVIKSGLLLSAVLGLSSCLATLKSEDASLAFYQKITASTITATTGVGAFEQSFFPFARKNCASCHGVSQTPLFATADSKASYGVAKNTSYVSFTSPDASKLAVYSGNGHCGLPGCGENFSAASALIKSWAAVEIAAAGGSGGGEVVSSGPPTGGAGSSSIVTLSVPIPATLPTGNAYVPMRWELGSVTPANGLLTGALFELEIQKLSATTYRVRFPKIAGLRSIVRFTGIHVLVKPSADAGFGVEDLGAGSVWENNVVNVAVSTRPATLPAGALSTVTFPILDSFSMIIGIRSNQDSLTIAFDRIESGAALAPTFASINTNILIPKCLNCHNANNRLGGVSYADYTATRVTALSGRLLGSTSGGNPSMPTGSLKLSATETTAISNWINGGSLNN